MKHLTQLPTWPVLKAHHQDIAPETMQQYFLDNPTRFELFSVQLSGLLFDYSKNRITEQTIQLLTQLAIDSHLPEKIEALFSGDSINQSEHRPALHTRLRDRQNAPIEVKNALKKMSQITQRLRNQSWLGSTGKPIEHIVNIGIGGSHLGPLLGVEALAPISNNRFSCYFISNIDSDHINQIVHHLDPETTLFIISSKSFTTSETLANAHIALAWLHQTLGQTDLSQHLIAITAAPDLAQRFGIPPSHTLPLWEWVGGRYSVWSAIGLPIALMIGIEGFYQFLNGAHAMDEHFRYAAYSQNIPVLMALLGIWYINFFDVTHHAIIPYSHRLNQFPRYIQQADMESNGKQVTQQGDLIHYLTGPVIFGQQGCDGQHAFLQLLHQGTHLIPVDFILANNPNDSSNHQDMLIASGLSQAEALMKGKSEKQVLRELLEANYPMDQAKQLAPHKMLPGNRPSNILFLDEVTPFNLGMLIALYEHKIFVQGALWEINSFDQWGVAFGKQLLPRLIEAISMPDVSTLTDIDSSTQRMIKHYQSLKTTS